MMKKMIVCCWHVSCLTAHIIPQQCLIHLFLSQCHVSQPAWKLLYDATQTLLQWHGRGPAELSYILQWVLQQMAVTGLSVTTLWPSVIWVSCSVGRPTMLACSARMSPVPVWRATKLTYEQVSKAAEAQIWNQCNSLWLYTIYIQMAGLIIYLSSLKILKQLVSLHPSAPCPPQNVVVGAQCGAGSMVVSWSPNPDAQYFHVAAVSNTGARLYCNSTGNSCTLNNLPCGQSYNITVLSIRDGCQSKPSAVVESSSGKLFL